MNSFRFSLAAAAIALATSAGAQTAPTKTYIVQLADSPVATYDGHVAGLTATRTPASRKLDSTAAPVRSYVQYLNQRSATELSRVPGVQPLHTYTHVFNGFSAKLTDAQVRTLRNSAGVASITPSVAQHIVTISTPNFLGIAKTGGLWSALDANSMKVKGENVIIGLVDTGVWPEDASFGDKVDSTGKPVPYYSAGTQSYDAPPAKWKGGCQTGPGFTAAMCNNKLIGAKFYDTDFLSNEGPLNSLEFASPRSGALDDGGHGTHTSSTAGGNGNVTATIYGQNVGQMSGIAPRARLAMYKACWTGSDGTSSCYTGDTLAAIEEAVKDGVDVLSYSISGSNTDFLDTIETAFFNASAAGVFVAAAAGNSGFASYADHPSPWLTTVAATSHDRSLTAQVQLGSGAQFTGASYQPNGLPSKPLILAQNAGVQPYSALSSDSQIALSECFNAADRDSYGISADAALDPTKVAGHIVVCSRGNNVLVNKADAVYQAGGAGVIIQNVSASADTTPLQFYELPTVHLPFAAQPTVMAYAAATGATASFSPAVRVANVVAPVMATFSSRGPNQASISVLKPDVAAPGVDIIAAWIDTTLTQAQRDGVAAGTFRPQSGAISIQGTSMATPHVAGAAALLKQLHPTWSPAAIRSSLTTTAIGVKLANGNADPDRWGYGAGNINPNTAADPGLVYDASTADYARFLCGQGLTPPADSGTCASLGEVKSYNLNLPSMTASSISEPRTFTRTVTNVSNATSTYVSSVNLPGFDTVVKPASLTLAPGASAAFTVTITRTSAAYNTWVFGSMTWFDGTHTVKSPLSALPTNFSSPVEVSDTRAKGVKVFPIQAANGGGSLIATPVGMVPATVTTASVATGKTQCTNLTVPANAQVLRFQLFDSDTTQGGASDKATNLDLAVFNGPNGVGTSVGGSNGATSNEVVTLKSPTAGTYSACVTGVTTPAQGAVYKLSSWVVGPATGSQTLRVVAPVNTDGGKVASVSAAWSLAAGKRYLGNIVFSGSAEGVVWGSTLMSIDLH